MRARGGKRRKNGVGAYLRRAFVTLSFAAIVSLVLGPLLHCAVANPAPSSVVEVANDLKATFGDAFVLCVNVDDDGSTPSQTHHRDEGRPLCCLHGAASLPPHDATALPARLLDTVDVAVPLDVYVALPPSRASPAQPRAPPQA